MQGMCAHLSRSERGVVFRLGMCCSREGRLHPSSLLKAQPFHSAKGKSKWAQKGIRCTYVEVQGRELTYFEKEGGEVRQTKKKTLPICVKRGGGKGGGRGFSHIFRFSKRDLSLLSNFALSPDFLPAHTVCGRKRSKIAIMLLYIFSFLLLFFATKVPLRTGPFPSFPLLIIFIFLLLFSSKGERKKKYGAPPQGLSMQNFSLTGCPLPSPNSDTNTHLVHFISFSFFFFLRRHRVKRGVVKIFLLTTLIFFRVFCRRQYVWEPVSFSSGHWLRSS